jgi:hypothetical protein
LFLRVVEVFPPFFPRKGKVDVDGGIDRFLEEVREVRDLADVLLVANLKTPGVVQVSPVETAAMLQELLRVDAAPVVVLRDGNRRQFLSAVLTALSLDLASIMVARGDDLPASERSSNVRDYATLAEAIGEAAALRRRAGSDLKIFAPMDLERLGKPGGRAVGRRRLAAGAALLLSQPPTTDPGATYDKHMGLLRGTPLQDQVLLNVFPFRDAKDVRRCERYFGWKLPERVHLAARGGRESLDSLARGVVARLRDEGAPGVYLSTRGSPAVAKTLLN